MVRRDIHYTDGCVHNQSPLAEVRLRTLEARLTGDHDAVTAALAAVNASDLSVLEAIQYGVYGMRNEWEAGRRDLEAVCAFLQQSADRARALGDDNSRWTAVELVADAAALRAQTGDCVTAQHLLSRLATDYGNDPSVLVIHRLATAYVDYAGSGVAARALPWTTQAKEFVLRVDGRPCLREVVCVPRALMLAASGKHDGALDELVAAQLPVHIIPPFWEPGAGPVLRDMLAWYGFTVFTPTPR